MEEPSAGSLARDHVRERERRGEERRGERERERERERVREREGGTDIGELRRKRRIGRRRKDRE